MGKPSSCQRAVLGHGVAVMGTMAVILLRQSFESTLAGRAPFTPFTLVIVVAAALGGLWPGLVATALSAIAGTYFFLPPRGGLNLVLADLIQVVLFCTIGVVISVVSGRLRRVLERRLDEQLVLVRTITDNATAALFKTDERGICTFMNPAAEAITGYRLDELGERPLHDVLHVHPAPPQPGAPPCALERALRGRERLLAREDEIVCKGGRRCPVLCNTNPIFQRGAPRSVVVEIRDVTEHKRIEEERESLLQSERSARTEAERASRLKDDFVATVSHELRTPLNAILGWTHLLRMPNRRLDQLDRGLEVVERNARLQVQLTSDLLDVSRAVSGKIHLDLRPLDLPEVIEAAVDGVAATAEEKGIEIRKRIQLRDARVVGDAGRIHQIVWNLMSNAIKFTPRGGRVDVTLSRAGDNVELVVSDTGPGIPEDFLPHLFDRFRQADASAARQHGGLGLGLSIAKHLVELHGGTIRAESSGPGTGARFVVRLSMHEAQRDGDGAPPVKVEDRALAPRARPLLEGLHVLVVEDAPDARDLVVRLLEEGGARVVARASAVEGLQALAEQHPLDVLVSDIGMPGMDGYAFIREIRACRIARVATLPALALTAFARPEDRARALAAGYQAHVAKPIDPSELLAAVAGLVAPGRPP